MSLLRVRPSKVLRLLGTPLLIAMATGCGDPHTPTATTAGTTPAYEVEPPIGSELEMNTCGNPNRLHIRDFGLGTRGIKAGTANAFVLEAYDAAGNNISFSCPIKWTIGNTSVAFIDGSSTNSSADVRGKTPGFTSLTVSYGGLALSRGITVEVGDPYRVVLNQSTVYIKPGEGARLTGTIYDRVGNQIKETKLVWTSDQPNAVSVASYDYDGITASVLVPNPPQPPYSAKVTAAVKDWPVGASAQVYVTNVPECYCPPGVTCTCYPAEGGGYVVQPS